MSQTDRGNAGKRLRLDLQCDRLDPVKAAKDIEEHGWQLHRWDTA